MSPRPLHELFDAMFHGKYRFDEFLELDASQHCSPVRWNSRTIYKASQQLRDFHFFLNGFLLDHLPVNERVSFAYRKGAALHHAVEPHAHSRAFYRTDLEKFFDSITSDLIKTTLASAATPITDLLGHLDHIIGLMTVDGALPIGFSTSPALSNACMIRFDDKLEVASAERQWIYTRYADDIMISAQGRESLGEVAHVIENCLTNELGPGFRLNQDKSKLTTIGRKVKMLGLVILPTGQVTIDREVRSKIEYQLHFYVKDRNRLAKIFEEDANEGMQEGLERLSGLISYAHSADPSYLAKLRGKFGITVIDGFLHRSVS